MASSPRSPQPAAPAQAELEISRQSRILAAVSSHPAFALLRFCFLVFCPSCRSDAVVEEGDRSR
jgi:hypothetical protein